MTIHKKLLIAIIVAASAIVPVASSQAQGFTISIGDRPYYTHGRSYLYRGTRLYWVPGHYNRRGYWIRGRYVERTNPYYRNYYNRNRGVRFY